MKEIKITIPEFITIGKYQEIIGLQDQDGLKKMLYTITTLTDYTEEEVREWPVSTVAEASNALLDVTTRQNEFYPLIKFGEEVYGYAGLSKGKFSEYLDMEGLLKDPIKNLHHIAAILYRPVVNHKFGSFSFIRKYGYNAINNKVEDPFKWYTVEKYDNAKREERSVVMKEFPVQLILGAMGFTLTTGTLSLNDTLYSESNLKTKKKEQLEDMEKKMLESLSQSIGGGSGLYTILAKPTSLV
jgi:hypothetical protein